MALSGAVFIVEPNTLSAVRRTVNAAVNISGGDLLALGDANEVSGTHLADAPAKPFGGVAATEKQGGDSSTTLGCYMDGIIDVGLCAAGTGSTCVAGDALVMSGANLLRKAAAGDLLTGALVGYAEEDGSASEIIRVRLRGGAF